MKNKYLKGAHLSERKVREMLKLFSEDLTATQIAEATGISRITINAYLKMFRHKIASWAEDAVPEMLRVDKSPANVTIQPNGESSVPGSNFLFGISKVESCIFTRPLQEEDKGLLADWNRGMINGHQTILQHRRLDTIQGIIDFKTARLLKLQGNDRQASRATYDELDNFWSMMRSRMVKFRGLNASTIYLHVKETEFRFNNRDRDLYDLLIGIMHSPKLDFRPTYFY